LILSSRIDLIEHQYINSIHHQMLSPCAGKEEP
jgi:hypothetical protein